MKNRFLLRNQGGLPIFLGSNARNNSAALLKKNWGVIIWRIIQLLFFWWLPFGGEVVAQQAVAGTSPQRSPTEHRLGSSLSTVPIYLLRTDGRWSASLTGDLKNQDTEMVEITLADGAARVMTKPYPEGRPRCQTKMKDRAEFGYLPCNSAFYSLNMAPTAAATLIRGVLSFGILTATDAASGSTLYTVSLDQEALTVAVNESKAVELARDSAPLFEYRNMFTNAHSSKQLRAFITRFDNFYDPESLVAQAREKLPAVIAREEERGRKLAEEEAQRVETLRQKEVKRQADEADLAIFRSRLKPGDRVRAKLGQGLLSSVRSVGMVVEVKPPLAYVQWENTTPNMQWIRLDNLLP